MSNSEPRNPFYILLLVSSLLFVVTALAVGLLPKMDQWLVESGGVSEQSPFKSMVLANGWLWLLYEAGAIVLFGILSMVLDRIRSLRKERAAATNPSQESGIRGGESGVSKN